MGKRVSAPLRPPQGQRLSSGRGLAPPHAGRWRARSRASLVAALSAALRPRGGLGRGAEAGAGTAAERRPALGPGGPGLPPSVGARLPPGRLRPRAAGWGRPAAPDGFWREKRGVETEPRGRSGPGAPNCLRCRGERGTPHVAIRRPLLEAEARRRWARTAALRAVPGGGAWRRHGAAPWGGRCARAGLLRSALLGQTWGSSRRR